MDVFFTAQVHISMLYGNQNPFFNDPSLPQILIFTKEIERFGHFLFLLTLFSVGSSVFQIFLLTK